MPYRRGRKWIGAVRRGSARIEKVFSTKAEAQNWESDQRGLPTEKWTTDTAFSLRRWANEYLDYAQTKFTAETYKEKAHFFRDFFQSTDHSLLVGSLDRGMVLDFLARHAKERSGNNANKARKNLLAAYQWGIEFRGFPGPNPFKVPTFPETRHPRYVPQEDDFWAAYEASDREDDRTLLLALLHTAARRGEILRLKWADVDFDRSQIRLGTRKNKDGSMRYDWVPMTTQLQEALVDHKKRSVNEWVFIRQKTKKPYRKRIHMMDYLCNKAGVKPFGFHAIRALSASILEKEGNDLKTIQTILRHGSIRTTEKYIHPLRSAREALETAFSSGDKMGKRLL